MGGNGFLWAKPGTFRDRQGLNTGYGGRTAAIPANCGETRFREPPYLVAIFFTQTAPEIPTRRLNLASQAAENVGKLQESAGFHEFPHRNHARVTASDSAQPSQSHQIPCRSGPPFPCFPTPILSRRRKGGGRGSAMRNARTLRAGRCNAGNNGRGQAMPPSISRRASRA